MWDSILRYLKDNKDALGWLFGSGVLIVVVRFAIWIIKEYRLRKTRTSENFPFRIIQPNSNVAKEILGGADDDPLADRNIPYQHRVQGRNTRRELEELMDDHRWILITGRTGLGKTREAVQLAQSLNNEGWTILYLTREAWLDAPAKLPNNIPERKLLFFLDDLNKKCLSSKAEIRPNANESLTLPIYEPFQERLQRTLEAFDTFCGKSEIRVIGTTRNEKFSEFDEPSEWDKLGWTKHSSLWERFKLIDLPESDEVAGQKLLTEAAVKANILIQSDELLNLAQRNDGTFRNLVENLASAKSEGVTLSSETFRDTLKGTWQRRYQRVIHKFPNAMYVYDAIELLRNIGIQIKFSTVIRVAEIISHNTSFQKIRSRWEYSSVLKQLIRTENILQPRDGQIEAKGYRIDSEKYLQALYKLVFSNWIDGMQSPISRFMYRVDLLPLNFIPSSALDPHKKLGRLEKIVCILFGFTSLIHNVGISYAYVSSYTLAESISLKALQLKNANILKRLFDKRSIARSWGSLGDTYMAVERFDEAMHAFKKAIELDPKTSIRWTNLGSAFSSLKEYDNAIHAYKKAIELDPKNSSSWYELGTVYLILNDSERALSAYQKTVEVSPNRGMYRASLVGALRRLGKAAEAAEEEKVARSLMDYENEYNRACFEAICDNTDKALRLLQIALEKKQVGVEWAQEDPDLDFIRDDPRFKELFKVN
jgi:tetratricopeptide (TPR) repeat protein